MCIPIYIYIYIIHTYRALGGLHGGGRVRHGLELSKALGGRRYWNLGQRAAGCIIITIMIIIIVIVRIIFIIISSSSSSMIIIILLLLLVYRWSKAPRECF